MGVPPGSNASCSVLIGTVLREVRVAWRWRILVNRIQVAWLCSWFGLGNTSVNHATHSRRLRAVLVHSNPPWRYLQSVIHHCPLKHRHFLSGPNLFMYITYAAKLL
jgi:hypothetical protein